MIVLTLNTYRDFGLGVKFISRSLSNYSVMKVEVDVLIFKLSFVFTKYNA
jgi:hypothetical protein